MCSFVKSLSTKEPMHARDSLESHPKLNGGNVRKDSWKGGVRVTNAKEKIEAGFETAPHLQSAMAWIQARPWTWRDTTTPNTAKSALWTRPWVLHPVVNRRHTDIVLHLYWALINQERDIDMKTSTVSRLSYQPFQCLICWSPARNRHPLMDSFNSNHTRVKNNKNVNIARIVKRRRLPWHHVSLFCQITQLALKSMNTQC